MKIGSGRDEEIKRTSRILQTIQLIALRPRRYRAKDLARHFEIGERMIKKDLEIAYCENRQKMVMFKVDRIQKIPVVSQDITGGTECQSKRKRISQLH